MAAKSLSLPLVVTVSLHVCNYLLWFLDSLIFDLIVHENSGTGISFYDFVLNYLCILKIHNL